MLLRNSVVLGIIFIGKHYGTNLVCGFVKYIKNLH